MNELKKENTEIKLKYSEEKFKLLFELSPVGMAIIDQETGKFLEVNNYLLQLTSYTKEEFLNLSFWDITPKKYEDQERQQLKDLNEKGQFGPNEKEYIRKDKSLFPIEISGLSFVDTDGRKIVWGLITDITEKKNNEIFAIDNKQILEYIATENSLENIFDKIVTLAQIRLPESKCSILLLDESKKHLFIGSAPDLPTFYNQAINGIEIGPEIGSCGSAVYYSKRVIVEDINNHENWKNYSNLTLKANLHSCWSEPIFSTSHEVLGTFGIYYCYPKKPSNFELKLIETYANLISKAIEKDIYTKNIKESKYQLEQLFNNAQSGLLYINEDRIVIRANQRFVNILGYDSPEEIIGLSVESFHLDKKQYEYFGKNNFDTLVEKEQFNLEYKLRKKDGSLIWCELAGKALDSNIPADLSKGVLWTIHDISLKKKYEVELKQREILLKNIISTIPDMLWLKDKEGTYLMCNEEFEKFFGAKEADIIGKTDYDFVDKKLADFFRHNDKVAMESKKVSKNDEWVNYASNNKRVLLETSKKSLKNQNDEIIGILGLGHDITKRKEREDELKKVNSLAHSLSKSQQVLLSLFDKGDSVLFKWNNDLTWSVDYASLSVLNFFGYTREQFLSKELSYSQCIHPEDLEKVINEVRYSIENNLDYFKHAPYRIITKDGQIKWVLDYTVTEKENNKIINFIGYITDITEQIKNQEILIQQSKLTSMGQMIGNIAHQWRQPLSAISTQATGMKLKKEFNDLSDEEFYFMCESINSQAQYLSRTIDDFKNFIKGDRTFQLLNVQKVIDKLLILLAGSIKNHHIKIISNIDNSIEFYGYENELIQCFINIFNNSKDALDEINANEKLFFLSTKLDKNNIELHFKDNAGGIDKEILPNIFNPYFTTKHESQGTGLGLFMTYNLIVEGMNGFIEAKNCEYTYNEISYKGVEMIISLPLHRE